MLRQGSGPSEHRGVRETDAPAAQRQPLCRQGSPCVGGLPKLAPTGGVTSALTASFASRGSAAPERFSPSPPCGAAQPGARAFQLGLLGPSSSSFELGSRLSPSANSNTWLPTSPNASTSSSFTVPSSHENRRHKNREAESSSSTSSHGSRLAHGLTDGCSMRNHSYSLEAHLIMPSTES